ncbi:MAG TPA: AAA family ATPase [Bacteroidales bacterium]|jgi:ABC-type ATPase involved in cell division|nr:AAA family ATPase [Bacteroidales bacterium]HQH24219.1 AAA family ATPase [Bacteroidales bacterium]HQJ81843.1 AAA family ATPase [Bacteroidales bacterium]
MMKLIAFRIRNFRSITDTGWQSLSPDNITCLIGQNESGKTSILEALKVFYTGVISEDVLRSDLSLPEVHCRFRIPEGWLLNITDNPGPELRELLAGLDSLELTRTWEADLSSVIKVSGAVSQYLDSLEDAWKIYLGDVTLRLEEEMDNIDVLEATLENISRQESLLSSQLPSRDSAKKPFSFLSRKNGNERAAAGVNPELYSELDDLRDKKARITSELESRKGMKQAGEKWKEILDRYSMYEKHMSELFLKLEERHQKLTLLMKPFDDEDIAWKSVLQDYRKTREDRDMIKSELDRHIAFSGYLLNGYSEAEAEEKVGEIIQSYKSQFNSEMLGRKYFAHCPVFEFFEDFSSLLPNRIDLHDIISGNEQVEGYKAARNFLTIARLDYSFFQQRSSRILKQKIENINQTLTTDFQDFWQQSIGRNNKIHIQFELDHYDATAGRKSGKPYLEFWIKDEGERLYPKQRSRGVRWFLSFYLELKASANINREMVLLVDEPGVSLHARAQEDVLKVFEDIRERIQVVYTTHSPHLVEINKLHRVLAIQRDDIDSMRSSTRILDPLQLSSATPDTLSPLQSILGNPLPVEGAAPGKFNLIVNDNGTFYLINAILHLTGFKNRISVIPSTGVSSIPLLCNILMGWGLDFLVLLFRNDMEEDIVETLQETVYKPGSNGKETIIMMPENFHNSEDLLSTLDFKNHILKTREGITVSNSDYIREKEMPRNFVFSRFLSEVMDGDIRLSDFDEETNENFRLLIDKLKGHK